jgi:hypothetical protein
MKNLLVIASLVLVAPAISFAAKIGPAGCGLGNNFFGTENQVLASTTNGSSGTQTFGITSGTSNCVGSSRRAQLETFVEVNQVALATDIARGNGETIASLSNILGCNKSVNLGETLKTDYNTIYSRPNLTPIEFTNGIENSVKNNQTLSTSCSNV